MIIPRYVPPRNLTESAQEWLKKLFRMNGPQSRETIDEHSIYPIGTITRALNSGEFNYFTVFVDNGKARRKPIGRLYCLADQWEWHTFQSFRYRPGQ